MRREYQLFLETEHVDGLGAPPAVKRAQCLNLFRSLDQIVAKRDHLGDVLLSMPPAARHDLRDFFIGDKRRAVAYRRDLTTQIRIRVLLQEIRKLHDMAVGVVHRSVVRGISHGGYLYVLNAIRRASEEPIKAPSSASAQGTRSLPLP